MSSYVHGLKAGAEVGPPPRPPAPASPPRLVEKGERQSEGRRTRLVTFSIQSRLLSLESQEHVRAGARVGMCESLCAPVRVAACAFALPDKG
jgi:hypothetical protein